MRKWGHSRNVEYAKGLKPTKEWERVLETIGYFNTKEALEMIESSKENMIEYYNGKDMVGKYIYNRVIQDIKELISKYAFS